MDMEEQKVVLITGGASGLGRILVQEFIKEEYKVCFTYRNSREKAQKLEEQYGQEVLAFWQIGCVSQQCSKCKRCFSS